MATAAKAVYYENPQEIDQVFAEDDAAEAEELARREVPFAGYPIVHISPRS